MRMRVVASFGTDGLKHYDMVDETMNPVAVFSRLHDQEPCGCLRQHGFYQRHTDNRAHGWRPLGQVVSKAPVRQHPLSGLAVVLRICWLSTGHCQKSVRSRHTVQQQ